MKKIVIEWEGGSDFQEECITKALLAALAAVQGHYLGQHKKNKVEITYSP